MARHVLSIERAQVTLSADGQGSHTLTKSQTIANCVPFVTKRVTTTASPADNWSQQCIDVYFSGSDLKIDTSDSATRALVCEVTIVEFDPARVTVQQGTFQITSALEVDNSTITAVTLANSYVVGYWKIGGAQAENEPAAVRIHFTSTTNVRCERGGAGGQVDGHFFVVESDQSDFTVEEVTVVLDGVASNTGTIASVDTSKTMLLGSFEIDEAFDTDDNAQGTVEVVLTNSTTVTVQRASSQHILTWTGYVVEFAGDDSVQRGSVTQSTSVASEDVDITAITLANGMVIADGQCHSFKQGGSFPGTATTDNEDAQVAFSFVDADTIRLQHGTGGGEADNDISWQVVEWDVAVEAEDTAFITVRRHRMRRAA